MMKLGALEILISYICIKIKLFFTIFLLMLCYLEVHKITIFDSYISIILNTQPLLLEVYLHFYGGFFK